jgi:hypothetical protein
MHAGHAWNDDKPFATLIRSSHGRMVIRDDLATPRSPADASYKDWFKDKLRVPYVLARDGDGEPSLYLMSRTANLQDIFILGKDPAIIDTGTMTVFDGRLAYIEHECRHLNPERENIVETLKYLAKAKVDLQGVYCSVRVGPYSEGMSQTTHPRSLERRLEANIVSLHDASALARGEGFGPSALSIHPGKGLEYLPKLPEARAPDFRALTGANDTFKTR